MKRPYSPPLLRILSLQEETTARRAIRGRTLVRVLHTILLAAIILACLAAAAGLFETTLLDRGEIVREEIVR